ncbi:MAG: hypothetical protein IIA73_11300 [Proteobacteria bacterium]|nr:hypothetical protein [Pseudomonadota bacterium]
MQPGAALVDQRQRLLDLGAREVDVALRGGGLLTLVVVARLRERRRVAQTREPPELLADERWVLVAGSLSADGASA